MNYICKGCGQEMKEARRMKLVRKGGVCIFRVHYHCCKTCGILLQEFFVNHSLEQIKQIQGEITYEYKDNLTAEEQKEEVNKYLKDIEQELEEANKEEGGQEDGRQQ